MNEPKMPYAGTPRRYEKWEKEKVRVVNVVEALGQESLQSVENNELTPKEAVDIDNRTLRQPNCPNIVFGRPHAGEYVPEELWQDVTEEAKKTLAMVDRGTHEIFKNENVPSVGTRISRFIVDPNRAPLMEMESANPKALGKVLWYKGAFGEDMYQEGKEPSSAEAEEWVEMMYLPYYNGMMGTIGTLADRREGKQERVLVIDGHSFPINKQFKFVWDHYEVEDPSEMPMFIIGDRDGESCDEDIREAFASALKKAFDSLPQEDQDLLMRNLKCKELVGVNQYLKGVHNVQFYGQRQEGVNSIQLELNEAAYVDCEEDDYYKGKYNQRALELMKKIVEQASLKIDPILKAKK